MTLFYRFSLTNSSKTADHFTMDTILGGALLTRTIVGTNVDNDVDEIWTTITCIIKRSFF